VAAIERQRGARRPHRAATARLALTRQTGRAIARPRDVR
jgi:hypothetical protein